MRLTSIILVLLLCAFAAHAQSPPGINYQGVARDSDGKALSQKDISIRISIVKDNSNGVAEYTEIHSVKTNSFGLFTLMMGGGSVVTGDFQFISWALGNKWLRVEMDADGGNTFKLMGSQQLMSVPYALYSKYAASSGNATQDLSLSGNKLKVTNNPTATDINLAPYLDNTDSQTLVVNGAQLSISGGNNVDLTPFLDNTDNQDLTLNANTLSLTNDSTPINLAPYLDNTDKQDLTLTANTLSLTNDATPIDLTPYLDNTDNQTLSNVLSQGNNAGGQKITNIGAPLTNLDAATKQYVDNGDAVINTRIAANYAFKATYSYLQAAGTGNDISLSLTTTFDSFGVLGSTNFTAAVAGTYIFVLDGSVNNILPAPTINLSYNGTKYPVTISSVNGRYNSTFMFQLTAGQTVSVVGDGVLTSYTINGSFYGYKLL